MIALLAERPLRWPNFAAIEIGRLLIRVGDGYHLVFDGSREPSKAWGEQKKNGKPPLVRSGQLPHNPPL